MDGFLTSTFVTNVLTGVVTGVVYGLIALSLVLIWRSTHVLNFAAGAMATLAAYVGMEALVWSVGYWWCVVLSIAFGMVIGGLTERLLMRPLYGKPEINPVVVMVGFLLLLESVIAAFWSSLPRAIPLPFSFVNWQLGGQPFALSPNDLFQIVAAAVVAIAVAVLFRFTNLGLQLRASAAAPEVSRLLGVRVSRMLTIGWMLSTAVGAVAAVIYASNFAVGLTPTMMEAPFAIAFIAAAVGGLDSPVGALFGGIAFGVIQEVVGAYLNANAALPIMLGVLVVVLMIRPQGLFGRRVVRRV